MSTEKFIFSNSLGSLAEQFVRGHYHDLTGEQPFMCIPIDHSGTTHIEGLDLLTREFTCTKQSSLHLPDYIPLDATVGYDLKETDKEIEVKSLFNYLQLQRSLARSQYDRERGIVISARQTLYRKEVYQFSAISRMRQTRTAYRRRPAPVLEFVIFFKRLLAGYRINLFGPVCHLLPAIYTYIYKLRSGS